MTNIFYCIFCSKKLTQNKYFYFYCHNCALVKLSSYNHYIIFNKNDLNKSLLYEIIKPIYNYKHILIEYDEYQSCYHIFYMSPNFENVMKSNFIKNVYDIPSFKEINYMLNNFENISILS